MTMVLENPSVIRGHKGLGIASFIIGVIKSDAFQMKRADEVTTDDSKAIAQR